MVAHIDLVQVRPWDKPAIHVLPSNTVPSAPRPISAVIKVSEGKARIVVILQTAGLEDYGRFQYRRCLPRFEDLDCP